MEKVILSGNYFCAANRRFVAVGVNWVPSRQAMQWPYEWDPASIEADFAAMASLGINCIRFDLVWAWFEPRPGQYNPAAFQQFDYLVSLAHKYDLYLNPAFFIGGRTPSPGIPVARRHSPTAHQNLPILGEFHLAAGQHLAD